MAIFSIWNRDLFRGGGGGGGGGAGSAITLPTDEQAHLDAYIN